MFDLSHDSCTMEVGVLRVGMGTQWVLEVVMVVVVMVIGTHWVPIAHS